MKKLSKENIDKFLQYYHDFHDSYIVNIYYDIVNSKIDLILDVVWSGEPILNGKTYETNEVHLKLVCYGVCKYMGKNISSWEYINQCFLDYINFEGEKKLCFATAKNNPLVYVICDVIEYEEVA